MVLKSTLNERKSIYLKKNDDEKTDHFITTKRMPNLRYWQSAKIIILFPRLEYGFLKIIKKLFKG